MAEPVTIGLRDRFWGAVAGIGTAIGVPLGLIALSFKAPNIDMGPLGALDLVAPFMAAAVSIPTGIAMGVMAYNNATVGSAYRHAMKS